MRGVSDYAVVYDITCDRERARVDRTLKNYGFRVQKSVFECRLNKKGVNQMIKKLEELKLETGFVKIYRLEYSLKNAVIGKRERKDVDEGNAFIV